MVCFRRLGISIAADRNDGQLGAVGPEQLPHTFSQRLADEVLHRAVDARNRFEQKFLVSARVRGREHSFPDALGRKYVLADGQRRERILDEAHDLRAVLAVGRRPRCASRPPELKPRRVIPIMPIITA